MDRPGDAASRGIAGPVGEGGVALPRTAYFVREAYSLVSVLIVIMSPSLTKCGT